MKTKDIDTEDPQSVRDFAESWERVGDSRGYRRAKDEDLMLLGILIDRLGGCVGITDLEKAKYRKVDIVSSENSEEMITYYETRPKFNVK